MPSIEPAIDRENCKQDAASSGHVIHFGDDAQFRFRLITPIMEKSDAIEIVALIRGIADELNKLHAVAEHFPEELKKEFRGHLGVVMATINCDILEPIIELYPDLQP